MKIPRTGHWPSDRVGKAIEDVCYWQWDVDGFWRGSCGIPWWMETGTPKENGMNYCPKCGRCLKQRPRNEKAKVCGVCGGVDMGFRMIEPVDFTGAPSLRNWKCICDCGKEFVARFNNLKLHTKSCGCLRRENFRRLGLLSKTHGHSSGGKRSPTYQTWSSMIDRCTRNKHSHFARYGGRGISVCDRWMKFENFFEDMGERPYGMTLDRIDNDDGYSIHNCRWSTDLTQANNRSKIIL